MVESIAPSVSPTVTAGAKKKIWKINCHRILNIDIYHVYVLIQILHVLHTATHTKSKQLFTK